jgi:hypothetical protein
MDHACLANSYALYEQFDVSFDNGFFNGFTIRDLETH